MNGNQNDIRHNKNKPVTKDLNFSDQSACHLQVSTLKQTNSNWRQPQIKE